MAMEITEFPHLAADLEGLYLSTVRVAVASPWAEQAVRQRQVRATTWCSPVDLEVTARQEHRIQDARC